MLKVSTNSTYTHIERERLNCENTDKFDPYITTMYSRDQTDTILI
jgi:hypothetical protein